jgi:hypothetical protein
VYGMIEGSLIVPVSPDDPKPLTNMNGAAVVPFSAVDPGHHTTELSPSTWGSHDIGGQRQRDETKGKIGKKGKRAQVKRRDEREEREEREESTSKEIRWMQRNRREFSRE